MLIKLALYKPYAYNTICNMRVVIATRSNKQQWVVMHTATGLVGHYGSDNYHEVVREVTDLPPQWDKLPNEWMGQCLCGHPS